MAPSPTAEGQPLTEPCRTSPAANHAGHIRLHVIRISVEVPVPSRWLGFLWCGPEVDPNASNSDFIKVMQKIERILIDPVSPGSFELFRAITSGEKADSKRSCAPRGKKIPNTVPDHDRGFHIDVETFCRR